MSVGKENKATKIFEKCWLALNKSSRRTGTVETADFKKSENFMKLKQIYDDKSGLLEMIKKQFKPKTFNDAIHKTVVLNEIEIAFIQTPEFFRLKNIKQLGAACHVYPGAVHTRFDHSLGVCHLAGEMVKTLQYNYKTAGGKGVIFSKENEMCVRLAGLCHDLGHGPFSHLFERVKQEIRDGKQCLEHEELSVLVLKWILIKHIDVLVTFVEVGLEAKHVDMIGTMIVPKNTDKKKNAYLYEIVANKKSGLDVDKWDYFARDCQYLGLSNEFLYGRTMNLSRIIQFDDGTRHIGFMEKEAQSILGMFRTRGILYQKASHHRVSDGMELMITDILVKIQDEPIFRVSCQKKSLKEILEDCHKTPHDLTGFLGLSDSILDIIQNQIESTTGKSDDLTEAQMLIERIKQRELYWCFRDVEAKNLKDQKKLKKSLSGKKKEDTVVQAVKISYTSEKRPEPVHAVNFFETKSRKRKREAEEDQAIPKRKVVRTKTVDKWLTPINIPKSYTDYRVRVYKKKQNI